MEGPTEQLHVVVEGVEIQCEKATKEMGRGLWDSGWGSYMEAGRVDMGSCLGMGEGLVEQGNIHKHHFGICSQTSSFQGFPQTTTPKYV